MQVLPTQLRVAVVTLVPNETNRGGDVGVRRAVAQEAAQIVALRGKQAKVQLAFGRQASAIAVATKRLGDAADHAHLAQAGIENALGVGVAPALCCLTRCRGFKWHQRELGLK